MKSIKILATLFILALLSSGALTMGLYPARATEPWGDEVLIAQAVEPRNTWNDVNIASSPFAEDRGEVIEPLPSDLAQDKPFGVFSASLASSAVQSSAADNWQIECVDCAKRFSASTDRSLRLDNDGHPHVAYGGVHLYYAWHDGTTWQIETVDSVGDVGWENSLALDGAGRPHISYYDATNQDLKYAWNDGTTWQVETVDSQGTIGRNITSLALDGAGRPHIGYHAGSPYYNLRYAWHDGTTWQIETVDSGWVDLHASLALDGAGRPHISYYGGSPYDRSLKYASHDGTTWQIDTVDSDGTYTSLALDKSGQPHISYFGSTNDALKYAWNDGTDWYTETVDSEGQVGWSTSLALDGADRPHISYWDYTNLDLKYAWHDGTTWQIDTVDSEGSVGPDSSLALDGAGRPHISYYGSGGLKYAWHNGTIWQIDTVASAGWVGSLALDGVGRPHISYYDRTNKDLKYAWLMLPALSLNQRATPSDNLRNNDILTYTLTISGPGLDVRLWDPLPAGARYISGSITGTVTPAAVYSPTVEAVVWQGRLSTDTVQLVRFQVTLDVADATGLAPVPVANTARLTDERGRSVLATATVNVLPPPFSLHKRATPSDNLRNNDILTYTLIISSPGSAVRLWDPLPLPVRYVSGSITSTVTPAAVYSPTVEAVVWQGRLPTDTVQTVRFQVTAGITGTESLSLSAPIVNTAWLTDTENGRSVSALAIVNGWRFYLPLIFRDWTN